MLGVTPYGVSVGSLTSEIICKDKFGVQNIPRNFFSLAFGLANVGRPRLEKMKCVIDVETLFNFYFPYLKNKKAFIIPSKVGAFLHNMPSTWKKIPLGEVNNSLSIVGVYPRLR